MKLKIVKQKWNILKNLNKKIKNSHKNTKIYIKSIIIFY
jgi:hypothetical protein